MIVSPGDLVVGDADGVLCVPMDQAQELLLASLKKRQQEEEMLKDIHAGTYEPHWLHAALDAKLGPTK
jgi:regulator of RNase E activity RraA